MAEKMFRVRIQAKDEKALQALPVGEMDTTCMGGIRILEDGTLEFDALVYESMLKTIKDRGAKVEVVADMARVGAKMKKQVGRGNRFVDDNWIPRGLGRKVQDEASR